MRRSRPQQQQQPRAPMAVSESQVTTNAASVSSTISASATPRGEYEKRILVTGGAGFIGSHVVIHLVKKYPQYYIVNLDSLDYCACVGNVHTAITQSETMPTEIHKIVDATGTLNVDPHHPLHQEQDEEAISTDEDEESLSDRLRRSFCEWDQQEHLDQDAHTSLCNGDCESTVGDIGQTTAGPATKKTRATSGSTKANDLPVNYKFIKGNIEIADLVQYILQTERIDTILHFAAQSHVDNSFGNSFAFSQTNILGTHVLLESSRIYGKITRFIHVSTDEVYGEATASCSKPMNEEHVLEPTNPYAATKAGAEFLVKAYVKSFKLPCIITRSNNVYGPHQYPEKLIPKFINQIQRGQQVTLHGDGTNTRNFLYIDDVVDAFDLILHKGHIGEIYNIGGKNEIANLQVAKDLLRIMVPQLATKVTKVSSSVQDKQEEDMDDSQVFAPYLTFVEDRAFNDRRYVIDSRKIREQLGWRERIDWFHGLRKTVKWYRRHGDRFANVDQALAPHPVAFKKMFTVV